MRSPSSHAYRPGLHNRRGAIPRVGFLTEQALGHVTYARNLRATWESDATLAPHWLPVPFSCDGPLDRLPGVRSNWAVRGSLRAYGALRAQGGAQAFDALFFHTQTVSLLSPLVAGRRPVIVSLDATPLNYDRIGAPYGHFAHEGSRVEQVKQRLYRRVFHGASALTTWSQWAKDSLRDDYGVDPGKVTVIAPGVNLANFDVGPERPARDAAERVRVLFVGGDFARKGGPLLLECMRNGLSDVCELHLVTQQPAPSMPHVYVYRDLGPNDPRLLALYRDADIFALPTYADCLAVVLGEAMSAALPIVTTTVGAQPEAVRDGHSGIVLAPGDVDGLGAALRRLAADPALRRTMGKRGREIAEQRFNARDNARRLADVIHDGIDRWHRRRVPAAAAPDLAG
jgi:glycosyltransferase involved in cell wall biosynthesis